MKIKYFILALVIAVYGYMAYSVFASNFEIVPEIINSTDVDYSNTVVGEAFICPSTSGLTFYHRTYGGNYPDTSDDLGTLGFYQNGTCFSSSTKWKDGVTGLNPPPIRLGIFNDASPIPDGNYHTVFHAEGNDDYYTNFSVIDGEVAPQGAFFNTTTRFSSTTPANNTTVATSSSVGYSLVISQEDYVYGEYVKIHFYQDAESACINSGAVYDAVFGGCNDNSAPVGPFDITVPASQVTIFLSSTSTPITFPQGGNWRAVYTLIKPTFFGLFNTQITSTSTFFTVGQPSTMDRTITSIRQATADMASSTRHDLGTILASTTARWKDACNPFQFSSTFNFGDCLTLTIWAGSDAFSENFTIIKQTPPWGYAFRFIDILSNNATSTPLPAISYDFASSSPMSAVGTIHFDPFDLIAQSGTLINEMSSDRSDHLTVWQILMPFVRIFVYLVLAYLIFHDITGVYSHSIRERGKEEK